MDSIFTTASILLLTIVAGCRPQTNAEPPSVTFKLTDTNFEEEVLDSKQLVLVDFWASWCDPCMEMAPAIEELARELSGNVKVGKLNVDHYPNVAHAFEVRALPTILVFRNGEVVARRSGGRSKNDLAEVLDSLSSPPVSPMD